MRWLPLLALLATALPLGSRAAAQDASRCLLLCGAELSFEPTLTFSDLFRDARVQDLRTGAITTTESERVVEMILAVGIETTIPRAGLTAEAIWAPFAEGDANPFTGYDAEELDGEVRENPVELELELNLDLLREEDTGGWLGTHFDIVDKFSRAERPDDGGYYTHKLNLELDTAARIFNWLPEGRWLRELELEGSLDYMVTGIPRAGDEVPRGEQRYLDDASPWSFSLLLVIPVAPLRP